MNKINILGINIKDYTLKEAVKNYDAYMKNGVLNTIGYISSKLLIMAANGSEEQREWIESLDMTICMEPDILCTEKEISRGRAREIEENAFLAAFLQRAVRERRSICLMAHTKECAEELQAELEQFQAGLRITGIAVLTQEESIDAFINEVNDLVPDIIISRLPLLWPEQLMYENKKKINAKIWLSLPEGGRLGIGRKGGEKRFMKYIYGKVFQKQVEKYRRQE